VLWADAPARRLRKHAIDRRQGGGRKGLAGHVNRPGLACWGYINDLVLGPVGHKATLGFFQTLLHLTQTLLEKLAGIARSLKFSLHRQGLKI